MRSFDLLAEHAKCADLIERDLAWLRDRDVPAGALIKNPLGAWSVMARGTVVFQGLRFEFARYAHGGEPVGAFIWPAHDEWGDVVDFIAWRPPATVATWLGRVGLAGEEMISAARFGEPLRVFEHPLAWLRAARAGVCVVDLARAAPLLRQAGRLAVGSMVERRTLEAILTVRPPRIEVLRQVQPAAACAMEPAE